MSATRNIWRLKSSFENVVLRRTLEGISNRRAYTAAAANVSRVYDENDRNQFKSTFTELSADLTNIVRKYDDAFVPEWFAKSLSYNANAGKQTQGHLVAIAFKMLADETQLTSENLKIARYVGWLSEMLEGAVLIVDDIIDGNKMRRKKACWHTLPEIQLNSINDVIMLQNGAFMGLKKYVGHKDYYPRIVRLWTEALFATSVGQTTDLAMSKENVRNQTMERYESIVQLTTCDTAFYFPVGSAMELCGYTDPWLYRETKLVLSSMGLFYKSRSDYQDCFGDSAVTGKEGTDISENKLSWMAVKTMERANSRQREIMESCYGQKDPEKVAQVLALYKEMEIDKLFLEHERESYERVNSMIEDMSYDKPKPLMKMIWDIVYYRDIIKKIN